MSKKIINLTYAGSRHFLNGLIEQSKNLLEADTITGWTSYCQSLVATRLNMKLVIGGVEQDVPDGRTLLDAVYNAAKAGKLTKDEAEAIASQLDRVSLRFTSVRTPFFVIAYEASEDVVEKELTEEVKEDIIFPELKDEAVVEEQRPKAGRKAKAK